MQVTYLNMVNLKILIKQINKFDIFCFSILLAGLAFFQYSNIDLEFQSYFFDFENKLWLVDKNEPIAKFFYYNLPKILFAFFALFSLFAAIIGFKSDIIFFKKSKEFFLLIFLGLALIPLIAGNIKKFTNIYCPSQLEIYNGDKPYVKIFDSYPQNFHQEKRGKCFPAGHAVTGFALFILFFALRKNSHKILGLFIALFSGWILGLYQIAKGAHFLSDTFISMIICFILASVISRIYFKFFKYD